MGNLLTMQQILDADDLETIEVPVPEWTPKGAAEPSSVKLRVMSALEAMTFTAESKAAKDDAKDIARILQICAVNEKNEPMFNKSQLDMLMKKSLPVLVRLQKAAMKLNGLSKDKDEVEKLAEERKNA